VADAFHRADEQIHDAEAVAEDQSVRFLGRHRRIAALVGIVGRVARRQTDLQLGLSAAGAAFWVVISAFPTAIAVVTLFGLFVSPKQVAADLGNLASAAPSSLGSLVTGQLQRVAASDHAGLSLGLAVSLVLALWSASAGVYNLDRAIRQAYGIGPQRYVEARGRAFLGAFGVVTLVGLVALAGSALAVESPGPLMIIVGAPFVIAGIAAGIAVMYRLSAGSHLAARALLPGAVGAGIGVVVLVVGFTAYVATSTHYAAVYGVFAAAVVGMIATYGAVYVVLLGAVLNVELTGGAERDSFVG
jgi:membrane protein